MLYVLLQAIVGGQRATMGFSAGAALLTMAMVNTSAVLRISLAAMAGFAVLVWCSRQARLSKAARHRHPPRQYPGVRASPTAQP